MLLVSLGGALIIGNLFGTKEEQKDPNLASPHLNGIYYAISRPAFVFGVFCIMTAIFTG
jgi:hypothetical protein